MSRRKRNRYPDQSTSDVAPAVQHNPQEGYKARHGRRLEFNLAAQDEAKKHCQEQGIELRVHNHGTHWQFIHLRSGKRVDWWPSTAKMILGQQWKQGKHVHDWKQALVEVERFFAKFGPLRPSAPPITCNDMAAIGDWL